jgi:hypothetical protein
MEYKPLNANVRIRIFKTFKLNEVQEGIYRDVNDIEKFYIRLPKSINWQQLHYATRHVKHRLDNPHFNAAIGMIYRFCGPEDVIRIYDQDATTERAETLRSLYMAEIKQDLLISTHVH